jgi:hypothetical protein
MGVPLKGFQSVEMAFFKALYSPACAQRRRGGSSVNHCKSIGRHVEERKEHSSPGRTCPLSAKSEIKQTASLSFPG